MAITYKGERRRGAFTVDADNNATLPRTLVFHFNAAESPLDVFAQSQIPARGSAHPNDSSFKLTGLSIDQVEGDAKSGAYEVSLVYTRRGAGNTAQDSTVAPWRRRPYDISIPSQEVVVPFQKSYLAGDVNGAPSLPVLNPAGDPYEDSASLYHAVLKFSYNIETFDAGWIPLFLDTVNNTAETVLDIIIPAQRGRIKSLFPTYAEEYNAAGTRQYTFWRVDVEIEISPSPWYREIMARGLYALSSAYSLSSKYRIYQDKDGTFGKREDLTDEAVPVDEPQRLNLDGTLYTSSLTGAVYNTFFDKFYADWNPLGFPETTRG